MCKSWKEKNTILQVFQWLRFVVNHKKTHTKKTQHKTSSEGQAQDKIKDLNISILEIWTKINSLFQRLLRIY